MEIRYIYDESLTARLPGLTYIDLRDMLPRVGKKFLRRMEGLIPISQPLFSAGQEDITVTVYRTGMYVYEESGAKTTYSVALAGGLMNDGYASVRNMDLTDEREQCLHCQWYWPLMIAGQNRMAMNSDKSQNKIVKRMRMRIERRPEEWYIPDAAETAHDRMETREKLERLAAAWTRLPQRERDVLTRSVAVVETETKLRRVTQVEIGRELGIAQSTVSDTIRRGVDHLRREMFGSAT